MQILTPIKKKHYICVLIKIMYSVFKLKKTICYENGKKCIDCCCVVQLLVV